MLKRRRPKRHNLRNQLIKSEINTTRMDGGRQSAPPIGSLGFTVPVTDDLPRSSFGFYLLYNWAYWDLPWKVVRHGDSQRTYN
jgi:hypothetical protein